MCVYVCACAPLCLILRDPMNCSPPGSSVVGFSSQEYWSGLPFPSPEDLPDPEIKPASLTSPELAGRFFTTVPCGKPSYYNYLLTKLYYRHF